MNYKEELEEELLEVINDLKKIKWMNCNADAINAKRMAHELRLNAILKALELANNQVTTSNKKKGGVKVGRN